MVSYISIHVIDLIVQTAGCFFKMARYFNFAGFTFVSLQTHYPTFSGHARFTSAFKNMTVWSGSDRKTINKLRSEFEGKRK